MSQGTQRWSRNQDSKETPQNLQSAPFPATPLQAALHGISLLLNTRLSASELDLCIELLNAEVHPKALADVVRPLLEARKEPECSDD